MKNLTRVADAQRAVEFLMERGGFIAYTKSQFAYALDWTTRDEGADRRRVEEVCNLTRDQERDPELGEIFGGFVICYSPSQGGMLLVDPTGDQPDDHFLHLLKGDLQRQQQSKTQNQRRLPTWKAAGAAAANRGDHELARLCWQAENEISTTGFVSGSLVGALMKAFVARGIDGP